MKVVCPACNARYRLPDDRVRGKVLKIRCKSCGNVFQVRDPNTQSADSDDIRDRSTRASGTFGAVGSAGESGGKQEQTSSGSFSDERIWYYSINGESYGPYRESELRSRFEQGQLGNEAYVWSDGFEQWKLASDVSHFASAMETTNSNESSDTSEQNAAGGKTMSLDSSELSEQLQGESEDKEPKEKSAPPATKEKAERKQETEEDDSGDIRNALASDSFGDAVESALDEMFSGEAGQAAGEEQAAEEEEPAESPVEDEKSKDKEDKDDDSLDELRSFLDKSRSKRKQKRQQKKPPTKPAAGASRSDAAEVPDERRTTSEQPELETQETPPAPPTPTAPDADEVEVTAEGPEETQPTIEPDEAPPTTTAQADKDDAKAQAEEEPDGEHAEKSAASAGKTDSEDGGDRDDDDSIDISDLLSRDLEGTGFGQQTAAHAAVDDKDERKSNKPLILIIIILLLGIAFVTAELLSDDEAPEPQQQEPEPGQSTSADEQPIEALPPSPQELRDRRLAFESASATVSEAVRTSAQEAFAAVPDSVKNPEVQRQVERQVNHAYRRNRAPQQEESTGDTPPGFGSPSPGFAQPSLGRADDGGGPSRQIFAQGLNSFVQQSVYQCQQVHQRREGELAVSRVTVGVRVVPSGSVTNVSVPAQIAATTFANCLRSQSRNWKFPSFSGDSVVLERTFIIQ